jgi:hypothetical protein
MLYFIVRVVTISFNRNNRNPIRIDINSTLKKLSFFLNFPEKPITMKPIITRKKGLIIVEI